MKNSVFENVANAFWSKRASNRPPKNQFFEWLKLGCQSVLISADI